MKFTITLILTFAVTINMFGQFAVQNGTTLTSEYQNPHDLRKTGNIMLGSGLAMTVGGVILVSSADWTQTTSNGMTNYNSTDGKAVLGVGAILIGIPLTVTGAILSSIGKRNSRPYGNNFQKFHLDYFQYREQKGISLAYTF